MSERPTDQFNEGQNRVRDEHAETAQHEASPASEETPPADAQAPEAGSEETAPAASGEAGEPSEDADYKSKYLRALADLENLRKRHTRNAMEVRKYGAETAIRELLPVLDNLERAVEAARKPAEENPAAQSVLQGVEMIVSQFQQTLQRLGVNEVGGQWRPFDPAIHEAMQETPSDEFAPGTVVEVLEKGYRLHDRLLRAAKVIVSKAPAEGDTNAAEESADDDSAAQTHEAPEPSS